MRTTALLILLLCASLAPSGTAQIPLGSAIETFEIQEKTGLRADVPIGGQASVFLTFRDTSRDGPGSASPGAAGAIQHRTSVRIVPIAETNGWRAVALPLTINSVAGQERDIEIKFQVEPSASDPVFEVDVVFTFSGYSGQKQNLTVRAMGYSPGLAAFTAQVSESYTLKPRQIVDVPITLRNTALTPRAFDMEVVDNPCGMEVQTTNGNLVGPRSSEIYTISLQAPGNKPYYPYDGCQLTVQVVAQDNPNQVRTAIINVQVAGFYMNPIWVFWAITVLFLVLLLFVILKRRKERIEEELLGKPQKPWTIPVEALYLRVLRQKDERAWYVVRHHLMEEEYQSSLLWYKAYKKATQGSRKKETLVLRQEKKYARWKAKWTKAIAKPIKEADKFEAKLQRKLDRKGRKQDRQDARKVRKITRRMSAAHAKQVEKALEKWQKQSRKATKKGLEAPPRPVLPEPDYPEEPEPRSYVLADHKWAKKAARFRARRVREQGNLEVKFEKADARHLAKLRRKVQRLARKLDDPDFIAEHPLLRSEA